MNHIGRIKALQERKHEILHEIAALSDELQKLQEELKKLTFSLDDWSADVEIDGNGRMVEKAAPVSSTRMNLARKHWTVLVADRSMMMRMLVQKLLMDKGVDTFEAEDGAEALTILKKRKVDLLVTEVKMPNLSGYELIGKMRQNPQLADIPVIVCTNRAEEKHVRTLMKIGVQGFLIKPVDPRVFYEKVGQFIELQQDFTS